LKKKINKALHIKRKLELKSNSKKISGNIFSKNKIIKVKSGQKIQGKIDLKP
jgi:hypothetical protein|tara:strand:+ start:388 stop:543 length:156 start_codon:yes stop_codon:yes gene_type:complete